MKQALIAFLKNISRFSSGRYFIILLPIGLLIVMILLFGHRQFGGYDQSLPIDIGWRLFNGQKPYQDFILTTPLAFNWGAHIALLFFGVRWTAFILITILYSVLTFVFHVILLRRLISYNLSVILAFSCQMLAIVIASFWWHNAITLIALCLFITAAFLFEKNSRSWFNRVSFLISFCLLLFMKPNMAGFSVLATFVVLFFMKGSRLWLVILYVMGILIAFFGLFVSGIDPVDVINSYLGVARSRGLPSPALFFADKRSEALVSIPLILLCMLPIFLTVARAKDWRQWWSSKDKIKFLLAFVGILSGFLGFVTNWESNLIGLAPILLSCTLIMLVLIHQSRIEDNLSQLVRVGAISALLALLTGLLARGYWDFSAEQGLTTKSMLLSPMGVILIGLWLGLNALVISSVIIAFFTPEVNNSSNSFNRLISKINILFPGKKMRLTTLLCVFMIVICGVAFYAGVMRWRIKGIGPFYTSEPLAQGTCASFFKNSFVSPTVINVLKQSESILEAEFGLRRCPDIHVFFGPRIEFAYAALRWQSPRNMPIWWHPGSSFPESDTQHVIDSFVAHQFRICIFWRAALGLPDFTRLPKAIIIELEQNYTRTDYADIVVYRR